MNNNPSNTPRTDAVFQFEGTPLQSSYADFARTLERELNAAQERIDFLDEQYSRQCGATQEWMRKAMDAQERKEGLRMAIEQFISNLPGGHTVDPQSVADDLRGILSALPSGQRFVRREVLAELLALARKYVPIRYGDDGKIFQAAQAELARTKGAE